MLMGLVMRNLANVSLISPCAKAKEGQAHSRT